MEKFKAEQFSSHKLILVCVATHYEGDPTDNAKNFHKWIKDEVKKGTKIMEGIRFAIFGLGDTSYEQYNAQGIFYQEAFQKLGGIPVHDLGVGNAETFTTEADFTNWKNPLWYKLIDIFEQIQPTTDQAAPRAKVVQSDHTVLPYQVVVVGSPYALKSDDTTLTFDMNTRNFTKSFVVPVSDVT